MPVRFISFEGVDGAGKSSHIDWLATALRAKGHEVVQTREPGGTPLGEKLRALLLTEDMDIDTELLLMYAARRQHIVEVIEPALAAGKFVITDRFEDSSYAYQGGGREIGAERMDDFARCCRGPRPDLTLYFDIPVEVAQKRLEGTRDLDRFETEKAAFHERVRAAYQERQRSEPTRIVTIDANRPIEVIRRELSAILKRTIGANAKAEPSPGPEHKEKCMWCDKPATRYCDAAIGFEAAGAVRDKAGQVTSLLAGGDTSWTCDAPMCNEHATMIGHVCGHDPDTIDRCPYHRSNPDKPLRQLVIFASEVDGRRRAVYAAIRRSLIKLKHPAGARDLINASPRKGKPCTSHS